MLRSVWVHGNSALLERRASPQAKGKATVETSFVNSNGDGGTGDIVLLQGGAGSGSGAAACLRMGWAARFVIFDCGGLHSRKAETIDPATGQPDSGFPKSGHFWCHYAIPTPVVTQTGEPVDHDDTKAEAVFINYESTDIDAISIGAVHVWDGNRRIYRNDSPHESADAFNGGIPGHQPEPQESEHTRPILVMKVDNDWTVHFGVCVSLYVKANQAINQYLEIRGVGVRFDLGGKAS